MVAFRRAVNPRRNENGRRISSVWAIGFLKIVAAVCSGIRAVPGVSRRVFRFFFPVRRGGFSCGCGRSHPRMKRRKEFRFSGDVTHGNPPVRALREAEARERARENSGGRVCPNARISGPGRIAARIPEIAGRSAVPRVPDEA